MIEEKPITDSWYKHIVKYIFWGLLLTLPALVINFKIHESDNRQAVNNLILTQGIIPYRNKQIECEQKNTDMSVNINKVLVGWRLEQNLMTLKNSEPNEILSTLNEIHQLEKAKENDISELRFCYESLANLAEYTALLLNMHDEFKSNYNIFLKDFKKTLDKLTRTYADFFAELNHIDITTIPQYNNFLETLRSVNIFPSSFPPSNEFINLSIRSNIKEAADLDEIEDKWHEFNMQTNKLFIDSLKKRL